MNQMILPWDDVENLGDLESPHAMGYTVAWDVCYASFAVDYAKLQGLKSIFFDPIDSSKQSEWGNEMSDHFMGWRQNVSPTMPALISLACDCFGITEDHPLLKPVLVAAILSEVQHLNPYHNTHHFHEVMTMVLRLCATHNQILHEEKHQVNADDIMVLMMAAAIHDFAHDGKGNFLDGDHYPSRLERKAIDHAKPFLMAAGCPTDVFDVISAIILSTDVSHGIGQKSPADTMRDIYMAHYRGREMPSVDTDFMPLVQDKKASLLALILGEADIAPSTGLSYAFSQMTTVLVAAESDVLQASANTLYGFMQRICHGQYLSPAARHLMAENFTGISLNAEQDSEAGALYA